MADDVATLRTATGSTKSQVPSITSNGQSTIGDTVFDFDDNVVSSAAYRRVLTHHRSASQRTSPPGKRDFTSRQSSTATSPSATDEGYASGIVRSLSSNTQASTFLDFPSDEKPVEPVAPQSSQPNDKVISRQTSALSPSTCIPDDSVRRSLSVGSTLLDRSASSKREKLRTAFRRLNTTSVGSLKAKPAPTRPALSVSPSTGIARKQKHKYSQSNISIDLSLPDNAMTPPIIKAAQAGAMVQVEMQIGEGVDIDCCHEATGRSALAVAAHCGKVEAVDYLIHHGAKADIMDASLSTPFHLAASRGHTMVLDRLMEVTDKTDGKDAHGRTALWVAAQGGHLETVEMLIASGFKVSSRAKFQMTALHAASMDGDVDMARLLIEHGADIEAKDAHMKAPIHHACERGHVGFISMLLNYKGDIETAGEHRRSPLIYAAMAGQREVVDYLLKKKASSRSVDEHGMTCLHWAALNGHVEVVELLVQKKMSLRSPSNRGDTALHLAAGSGQFAVVEYLLRKGAPLEARCLEGLTPLHHACRAKNVELARLLLGSGADIEAQAGTNHHRPIHIATSQNNLSLLDLLCEKSANIDSVDSIGFRSLCIACNHGYASLAKRLLEAGAAPRLKMDNKPFEDSPLCLAAKGGYIDVVSILLDKGESVAQHDEMGYDPLLYAAHYGHVYVLQLLLQRSSVFLKSKLHQSFLQIGFYPYISITEAEKDMIKRLILQPGFHQPSAIPLQMPGLGYCASATIANNRNVAGAGVPLTGQPLPPTQFSAPPSRTQTEGIAELPAISNHRSRTPQPTQSTENNASQGQMTSVGSLAGIFNPPLAPMQAIKTNQNAQSLPPREMSSVKSPLLGFGPSTGDAVPPPRQPNQKDEVEKSNTSLDRASLISHPERPVSPESFYRPASVQIQYPHISPPSTADPVQAIAASDQQRKSSPDIWSTHRSGPLQVLGNEPKMELGQDQDGDSDNDSLISVYTAPEELNDVPKLGELPRLQVQLAELEG